MSESVYLRNEDGHGVGVPIPTFRIGQMLCVSLDLRYEPMLDFDAPLGRGRRRNFGPLQTWPAAKDWVAPEIKPGI